MNEHIACPTEFGPELINRIELPCFFRVRNLTGNTGGKLWRGLADYSDGELGGDCNNEIMPKFLSEVFSNCSILDYGGVCCDFGNDLNWTRAVSDEHELVSLWVCPANLDQICKPLWQAIEFLFHQKPDAVPHWQLLTAVYGKFIRRACIAGESKIDHAAIWSHFFTGLAPRGENWAEPSAYADSLVFQFIKANEFVEKVYGPVCGKNEGELWNAIDGFISSVIQGRCDGTKNTSVVLSESSWTSEIEYEFVGHRDKLVRSHRITDSAVFLLKKQRDRRADYIELDRLSEGRILRAALLRQQFCTAFAARF